MLGGRLERLGDSALFGQRTLLLLLFSSQVLQMGVGRTLPRSAALGLWCVLAFLCAGIAVRNVRRRGMGLVGLGLACNLAVVMLNSGMPVILENVPVGPEGKLRVRQVIEQSWLHTPAASDTRCLLLGDTIPVTWPSWLSGMVSLGDILMAVGVATYITAMMLSASKE